MHYIIKGKKIAENALQNFSYDKETHRVQKSARKFI